MLINVRCLFISGPEGDFFTGVMYNIYDPPTGFCFDTYCDDEPIMDNPKLHGVNVNKRVSLGIPFVRTVSLDLEIIGSIRNDIGKYILFRIFST